MGLDMYLTGKLFVGGEYAHRKVSGNIKIEQDETVLIDTDCMKNIKDVVFSIGYWRKANQIHSWFVRECQYGRDECQETHVRREDLRRLLSLCVNAKENNDPQELMPQSGFFFGNTEVNQMYWQDIDDTIRILNDALTNPQYQRCAFYYQSSW